MYRTTSCVYHGDRGEDFLSVSPLMEANDSCGMASLDTSSMDVGMTVFPIIILLEVFMPEIKSN